MKKKNFTLLCILQGSILVICLLSAFVRDTTWTNAFTYFAYQLFAFFVPGLALVCLTGKNQGNGIICVLWAYVCGVLIALLEYPLIMILNLARNAYLVQICITAASIFVIRKKGIAVEFDTIDYGFVLAVMVITLITSFFSIAYQYPLPNSTSGTVYNKDFLFWVGNCISFTKGLPVQKFRLVGFTYYYHYFSNIIAALGSIVTNIDVFTICYDFSFIIPCVLLTMGSYAFLREVTDKSLLIYVGMIGIMLSEGSTSFLIDHLYFCPLGFDYGYAFSMIGVAELIHMVKNDDYSIKGIVITCILIMITTGSKGPSGVVMLMGFGVVAFALLIEKEWKKGLVCGFLWLLSFLLIYYFVIVDKSIDTARTNGLELLGLGRAFDSNPWALEIFNDLRMNHNMPDNATTRLFSIFLYVFRTNKLATVFLIVGVISQAIAFCRKNGSLIIVLLMAISFWGIGLTLVTHQDGNSQMYFIMNTIPFSIAAGICSLNGCLMSKKPLLIIECLLMILISFDDIKRCASERIKPELSNSVAVRNGRGHFSDSRYFFSEEDYDLSLWLKENTASNDYIAIDEFEYDGLRKEEGVGVFSERFIWNDGQYDTESERGRRRRIVNDFINGNELAFKKLINENVKYIVITEKVNGGFDVGSNMASLVYNNGDYRVYKLKYE